MEFKSNKLEINNYKPLREIVFEHLRKSILNGELEPGERLMELQLADVSIKDILDVLEVRMFLEGLAAYLAAERMIDEDVDKLKKILKKFEDELDIMGKEEIIELDIKFHDMIIRGSKNNKLMQIVQGLQEQFQRFRVIYFNEYNEYEDIKKYHRAIVEAISNKDSKKAQEYAQTHVQMIEESIIKWKKKNKITKE